MLDQFDSSPGAVPDSLRRVVRVIREEAAALADISPMMALALEQGADRIEGHRLAD